MGVSRVGPESIKNLPGETKGNWVLGNGRGPCPPYLTETDGEDPHRVSNRTRQRCRSDGRPKVREAREA